MNCSFYSRHCPTTLDPFSKFIVFMFHVSRGTPFWTYCALLPVLHVIRLLHVIRFAWCISYTVYDIIYKAHTHTSVTLTRILEIVIVGSGSCVWDTSLARAR